MKSGIIAELQCECSVGVANVAFNELAFTQIVGYARKILLEEIGC